MIFYFIPDKVSGKTSTLALATKAGSAFNAGDRSVKDFVILFEPVPELISGAPSMFSH
jgi:hypothetical protein